MEVGEEWDTDWKKFNLSSTLAVDSSWGISKPLGGEAVFDGDGDYVNLTPTLADNDNGSVSVWVNIDISETTSNFFWGTANAGCGTGYKYMYYNPSTSKFIAGNYISD